MRQRDVKLHLDKTLILCKQIIDEAQHVPYLLWHGDAVIQRALGHRGSDQPYGLLQVFDLLRGQLAELIVEYLLFVGDLVLVVALVQLVPDRCRVVH